MKKYVSPNAEYVTLLTNDIITESFTFGEVGSGNISADGQKPDSWT